MFTSARFADYRSPAWTAWRDREQDGTAPVRYCGGCGFSHRANNHAPKRTAALQLPAPPPQGQQRRSA